MNDWDSTSRWRAILERRLNTLGSQVKGTQDFQADRITDVVEQIEELRQTTADLQAECKQLRESLGKAREAFAKLKNGGGA